MNFTFESRKPKDGQFGSKQKDGTWSGMVGELMDGSVDMGKKFRIHVAFFTMKIVLPQIWSDF